MKKDDVDFIRMYMDYCEELEQYFAETEKMSVQDRRLTAEEYIHDRYSRIILARPDIGFLVVTRSGGDCHPMADYAISQLYVRPEYRRRGIAKDLVVNFVKSHGGTYVLDILKGNGPAEAFWEKTTAENGWRDAFLPEIRPESSRPDCVQRSFTASGKRATDM